MWLPPPGEGADAHAMLCDSCYDQLTEPKPIGEVSIRETFGVDWDILDTKMRTLIVRDVQEIAEEENISMLGAAVLLRRRIGGQKSLRSYADTLAAGERRRIEP